MKRVLVLDANQRNALAVTRSLGKRGIPVFTADESSTALAGCSRFSTRHLTYLSPFSHKQEFITSIARIVREYNIQIVFPMTELTTTLLLQNRQALPDITLPFPDMDTVNSLADKCALIRLAESLDVPVPHSWYADAPSSLPVNLNTLSYPIVLKPGKSWVEAGNHWLHTAVRFAGSPSEATAILESDPAFSAGPFMLQECVPGKGQGVFALYDHGKELAFFAHRRLREKPPRGGVSVLSESIALDPDLLSYARCLLNSVGWHGIAMVEFRVSDNGTPYLMEINTRFWGSLQLAVDAGVDFPWLLYQVACGEKVKPAKDYKVGRRLRWVLGDLDSLYLVLRTSEYSWGEKVRAILMFLRPDPFRTRHEVNRWGDLGPFWWELKRYLGDLVGRG